MEENNCSAETIAPTDVVVADDRPPNTCSPKNQINDNNNEIKNNEKSEGQDPYLYTKLN